MVKAKNNEKVFKIIIIVLIIIIILISITSLILILYLRNKNKKIEHFEDIKQNLKVHLKDGMNNTNQILFINLDNRTDRLEAITKQLNDQGVNMEKVHRITAHYTPGNGHLGCAKSHRDALKYALDNNFENVIILEDDFKFNTKPEETKDLFNKLFNEVDKSEWDVILLAYSYGKPENSKYSFLNKITDAQGGSGYIINKNYYQVLIDTFQKSIDNMKQEKTSGVNWEQWALDQVWKVNQKNDKWFAFNPLIGKQDNELKSTIQSITNYNN